MQPNKPEAMRVERMFASTAGIFLLITAAPKLISACGRARVLQLPDPIFGLSFRTLFWVAGGIEAVVALLCLGKNIQLQIRALACLATCFAVYRAGLILIGYQGTCSCLGTLTQDLHVQPRTADWIMGFLFGYLLVGSYSLLLSRCLKGKRQTISKWLDAPLA